MWLVLCVLQLVCGQNFSYEHQVDVPGISGFQIKWTDEGDQISFCLSISGAPSLRGGWLSIGFPNPSGLMSGSDAVIGWIDTDGVASVQSYFLKGQELADVNVNPSFHISDLRSQKIEGSFQIMFTRPYDTGKNPLQRGKSNLVNAARGPLGHSTIFIPLEHDDYTKSPMSIEFSSGHHTTSLFNLKNLHGAIMAAAWDIFIPFGIMFARFGKSVGQQDSWFLVHRTVQIAGVVFCIGAGILIFVVTSPHLANFHAYLGTTLFIVSMFQVLIAVVRPEKEQGASDKIRTAWELIHANLGRILVLSAWTNIGFGIFRAQLSLLFFYSHIGVCVIWVILFGSLEIKTYLAKREREREANDLGEFKLENRKGLTSDENEQQVTLSPDEDSI